MKKKCVKLLNTWATRYIRGTFHYVADIPHYACFMFQISYLNYINKKRHDVMFNFKETSV